MSESAVTVDETRPEGTPARPAPGPAPAAAAPAGGEMPKFVQGSTMRHVLVMTATGSVGLMAIFLVDFLSLLYISWLGNASLTAAVGFATIVLFFATSINIGLMIAVGALVSRALGARERDRARRLAASLVTQTAIIASLFSLAVLPFVGPILTLIGATGEAHAVAARFLAITLPSNVLMGLGMALSGVLRAVGDARRAMYVTLAGGVMTAIADPIFIFLLGLGVDGAAIVIVLSRATFVFVGLRSVVKVHHLMARPHLDHVVADMKPMLGIAVPAILTNVATPVANAFIAATIARFGDTAIAASAIIDRLIPLCFGVIFALSGAVGPILGQNWGARRFDRMHGVLVNSLVLVTVYVLGVWLVLVLLGDLIPRLFHVAGTRTGELVVFFSLVSGAIWLFNGFLFVANAAFNNLGFPLYATAFNWTKATLGTLPFAALGARLGGVEGVMLGIAGGALIFGIAAAVTAFRAVARLAREG
ncbi:MATE family efflux transporter [Chelatococcus sp. SYSU_G07232]|uniref:MATE family efflux transporter n=1 Tax=Chelatococcus albus TaxID=3047466 RepID=A0ABT7AKW0_9HYPH|nr:MATE family efflux transporter [Chelatococcus sp. SYSU_G07232]MDJ1160007.1 MATE family efflux transporter [Chelatococcus sp. SYSU_G07232]